MNKTRKYGARALKRNKQTKKTHINNSLKGGGRDSPTEVMQHMRKWTFSAKN